MIVRSLSVQDYRNIADGILEASPTVNVIYGENAQGKTNLLEALWLFTGGRSFRGAKDAELIRIGRQKARASLCFYSGGREQQVEITVQNGRRAAKLNGVEKKSPSELVGSFCAVLFCPEHLRLVKDGPALRRSFLDSAICQCRPAYAGVFSRYQQSLLQRNSLLKDIPHHAELLDTLDVWDERLAGYGGRIIRERRAYIERIRGTAVDAYAGISRSREKLAIDYQCTAASDGGLDAGEEQRSLLDALRASRREDVAAGHTSVGPHRDDLRIEINGLSARSFGSQGQQRSIVLALKLAEAAGLEAACGEPPVVLLDDVLSELDASRQDYLLNHLSGGQVFMTCCEPEAAGRMENGALFHVEDGRLEQASAGSPAAK